MTTFDLSIDEFSKIEGKASLTVKVKDDKVEECKFAITEYKRFYTQALRGKDVSGLPQLSCRICGTCSNAHLLCAIMAVEHALGITVSVQTKILRQLTNWGLIIRDHALHCYVFALPDIFGIDNILELNDADPVQNQLMHDTFTVKAAGNELAKAIAGRSVHAQYPTIGGYSRLPDPSSFPILIEKLEKARPAVLRLIDVFVKCAFDYQEPDIEFVALIDDTYTMLDGAIIRSNGDTIRSEEYGRYLEHTVIPYSHASGYKFDGKVHYVGALARLNLAKEKLHPKTREDARVALSKFPSKNIYHNNLAQAIEILHAIDSSLEILKNLKITQERPAPLARKAACGIGVLEAPRGTLYYKICVETTGRISDIAIVVPTGQNQISIEKSLSDYISKNLDKDKATLVNESERIVRTYDPCMSCASHFLKVKWIEESSSRHR